MTIEYYSIYAHDNWQSRRDHKLTHSILKGCLLITFMVTVHTHYKFLAPVFVCVITVNNIKGSPTLIRVQPDGLRDVPSLAIVMISW